MNFSNRSIGGIWTFAGGLLAASTLAVSAQSSPESAPLKPVPLPASARYSGGIADIVKLADAKVSDGVVVAYIQASTVAFQPSAGEILMLKDHGLSDDAIKALLQRGEQLRSQRAVTISSFSAPPAPSTAAPGAQPAQAPVAYPGYTAAAVSPDYGYAAYPSSYYYPSAYYYPSSYYYPSYSIGLGLYWPWYGWGGYGWRGRYGYGWHGGYGHGGGYHGSVGVHVGGHWGGGGRGGRR